MIGQARPGFSARLANQRRRQGWQRAHARASAHRKKRHIINQPTNHNI